jgi:hypothetical protein
MTDKTIADVLDHGIEKLSGGAAEIAKAAKQVAPHAWEVAVRQQVVEACVDLASCLLLTVAAALLLKWGMRYAGEKRFYSSETGDFTEEKPTRSDKKGFASGRSVVASIALFAAAVCAFGTFLTAQSALMQLSNPEYYAAKAILEAVK